VGMVRKMNNKYDNDSFEKEEWEEEERKNKINWK